MKKIYFIADFFVDKIRGGGEIVNQIIIENLRKKKYNVVCLEGQNVTPKTLEEIGSDFVLIANFIHLSNLSLLDDIEKKCNYAIIEHDHKYLKTRDPSPFKNYIAPENQIINKSFYANAKAVFCQSTIHAKVVSQNLNIDNVVNLGCSLWGDDELDHLESLLDHKKDQDHIIVSSTNKVKGTEKSISFCRRKNLSYNLVGPLGWQDLMVQLSKHKNLVFFSQVLETFCRLVLEAKMLNCKVITNGNNGCTSEDWFKDYTGKELIDFVRQKKQEVLSKIENVLEDKTVDLFVNKSSAKREDITVILNSYRRPYNLNMQMKAIQNQTVMPHQTWLWVNDHEDNRDYDYNNLGFDRIFNNDYNWKFYGRFAAALLADTEYVAIFDDDTIPGAKWFENCLNTMKTHEGIMGSAGYIQTGARAAQYEPERSGWPRQNEETMRVDYVGHAWFFKREWLSHLWREKPPTWDNGEDIYFSYTAQKYGGIQTYCPPHPPEDKSLHGSLLGYELGVDTKATSNNHAVSHQQFFSERDYCINNSLVGGWKTVHNVKPEVQK